ncbi:MAG: hypothetical protein J6D34_07200 [Atopobiaceae bacterium]|nr:hypothetical protein [Atopobiaceae bacterium]
MQGSTAANDNAAGNGQLAPQDSQKEAQQPTEAAGEAAEPESAGGAAGHGDLAGIQTESLNVPVRETVDAYTWEELGALARAISNASTDEQGLQIAAAYHLCDANGKLDGSQAKRFTMADGTEAWAQIMGFRHDEKSDGSGLAGISFITKDCVAQHYVNEEDNNIGGWEGSAMRAWLGQEVFPALPEDLRSQIVAVDKLTNNVGRTDYTSCISKTSDAVWLVSMEEIVGVIEKDDWMRSALGNGWYTDEATASDAYERLERLAWTILNLEGTQYQLFPDLGLDIYGNNPFLIKTYQGEVVQWWERNPSPGYTNNFHICHRDGSPDNTERPQTVAGVAISFCL